MNTRRKLLLVDDDRLILATTAAALRAAGYEVAEADSVDAALALLARTTPDLALLDIRMGPVGGFDLARELQRRSQVPFVFLSGYIFPIGGMPEFFQWTTYLVPAKYAIDIVRGIVLRGATAAELWQPIALLSLYTVAIVGMAVMRFKKTAA